MTELLITVTIISTLLLISMLINFFLVKAGKIHDFEVYEDGEFSNNCKNSCIKCNWVRNSPLAKVMQEEEV